MRLSGKGRRKAARALPSRSCNFLSEKVGKELLFALLRLPMGRWRGLRRFCQPPP